MAALTSMRRMAAVGMMIPMQDMHGSSHLDEAHGCGRHDDPDAGEEQQCAASPVPDLVEVLRLVVQAPEEHAEPLDVWR